MDMKIVTNADKTITSIYPFNLNKFEGPVVIQESMSGVYETPFIRVHSEEYLNADEAAQFAAALCVARTVWDERNKRTGLPVPKLEQEIEQSGG